MDKRICSERKALGYFKNTPKKHICLSKSSLLISVSEGTRWAGDERGRPSPCSSSDHPSPRWDTDMLSRFHTPALCGVAFHRWCVRVTALWPQCWAGVEPSGEHRSVLPQWLLHLWFPKDWKGKLVAMITVKAKGKGHAYKGHLSPDGNGQNRRVMAHEIQGKAFSLLSLEYKCPCVSPAFLVPRILYAQMPILYSRTPQSRIQGGNCGCPHSRPLSATLSLTATWRLEKCQGSSEGPIHTTFAPGWNQCLS